MGQRVIEVSTEVFLLLQRQAPGLVEWADEQAGPTQKIVLPEEVYEELIDQAIARRKTLDQVIRDFCRRRRPVARLEAEYTNRCRRWMTDE